jgi:PIN domain nuclease of toxin-antitoxin system
LPIVIFYKFLHLDFEDHRKKETKRIVSVTPTKVQHKIALMAKDYRLKASIMRSRRVRLGPGLGNKAQMTLGETTTQAQSR